MTTGSSLVLVVNLEKKGSGYHVSASGPLGSAQHDVAPDLASRLAARSHPAHDQGASLYEALVAGAVRSCLHLHRIRARQESKLLRLAFKFPPDLLSVPWSIESLHDATAGEDLALIPGLTLVRSSSQWSRSRLVGFGLPLKLLCVIPEPADAQPSGSAALWGALANALQPLTTQGHVLIERLQPATERTLEERLKSESWHVLHFVGQGSSRPAARYGTLNFESSDRRVRAINAQSFARICEKCPNLGVVILQSTQQTSPRQAFEVTTSILLETGIMGVVWLPDFAQPQVSALFTSEFLNALATGQLLDQAVAVGRRSMAGVGGTTSGRPSRWGTDLGYWAGPVLFVGEQVLAAELAIPAPPAETLSQAAPQPRSQPTSMMQSPPATNVGPLAPPSRDPAGEELDSKRASGDFDVFLCHNVADKPLVKEIGKQLMEHGILPWLDEWELRPGVPWQNLLEEAIGKIKSAAVFVGGEGIGPWQRQELDGFLRQFAERKCPVIPVLLPGAPGELKLPLFLTGMTWVDFRLTSPNPLDRLIWGITGRRPDST